MMLNNFRLIRALNCQTVDRTPLWIMRQAGRYLPEYRELRQKAKDFLTLCKTPELACTVTLQPLARFPFDAAIIFSDILTIPDAYGLGLYFVEGEGPHFKKPIRTLEDIKQLPSVDPELDLGYVMQAISMVKQELNNKVPLIGFAGSPWTIATYMVEGGASKHFNLIKRLRYQEPKALHQLLSHLTQTTSDYLKAQFSAGADIIMLFDTWGEILGQEDYMEFSLQYMQKIIENINNIRRTVDIPIVIFSKTAEQTLLKIATSGCKAIGVDWRVNLAALKQKLRSNGTNGSNRSPIALQGNLDPSVLYASPEVIRSKVQETLEQYGAENGHIFNLGHGILPDVPLESVYALVDAVVSLSPAFHGR